MPNLWIPEQNEWTPRALSGDACQLPGPPPTPSGAVLRRAGTGTPDSGWHLLAPPTLAVCVNGEPLALGIRALRHRDEIRVRGATPVFFSTEQLVAVEPFSGSPAGKCQRCSQTIAPGSPAIRCGSCNTWYHQTEARHCFSYGQNPICVVCGADATVSTEFNWVPEEI
jgi:hypothetical protein